MKNVAIGLNGQAQGFLAVATMQWLGVPTPTMLYFACGSAIGALAFWLLSRATQ